MTAHQIERRNKNWKLQGPVFVHVHCTGNNTIITATDVSGNTVCWSSPGSVGFKGSKRSTSYAAQIAAESLGKKLKSIGVSSIKVFLKGLGEGRESSIRGFKLVNLQIISLSDVTAIPYNGCKLPKRRRI